METRADYQPKSDHELLIDILVKQGEHSIRFDNLDKQFTNHLQHHWACNIAAISAALTALAGFAVSLILLLIKSKGLG